MLSLSRISSVLFCLMAAGLCAVLSSCSSHRALDDTEMTPHEASGQSAVTDRFVHALLLAAKEDYPEAAAHYRSLLERSPDLPALNYAMAKAQVAMDMLDSARYYSERAAALDRSNKYYSALLAAVYQEQNDYAAAAREYQRLASLDPSDIGALYSLAQVYLAGGEQENALEVFLRILEFDPADELTLSRILWLELKLKHYMEAIGTLQSLIEQGSGSDKLRLTLGELYLQVGEPDKAIAIFEQLIERRPGFLPAWIALLEAAIEAEDDARFSVFLDRLLSLREMDFDRKKELARLFMLRSELDDAWVDPALQLISRIASQDPDNSDILLMRGIVLNHLEHYSRARDDFDRVLRLEPSRIQAWEEMASSYLSQDQFHHVLYTVRRAKEAVRVPALRLLVYEGYALFRLGVYDDALSVLEGAGELVDRDSRSWLVVQLHVTRAMIYEKQGLTARSIAAYHDVLALDPDNALALNNVAYMMAEQGEQLQRALEYARKAVEQDPDNPVFLDTLGWALYRNGKPGEALGYLEKALQLKPDEPEIAEHLREVLDALE
ncbi:MAG: tetratricopeptide repeat protein [Prosthecochloris sp.]|nr:tetratricopeptide repeat protein [Prosthecochloris sp.]